MAIAMSAQSGRETIKPIRATAMLSTRRMPRSPRGRGGSSPSRSSWRWLRRQAAFSALVPSIGIVIRVVRNAILFEDLNAQVRQTRHRAHHTEERVHVDAAGPLARIEHQLVTRAEVELVERQAFLHRLAEGIRGPDHF